MCVPICCERKKKIDQRNIVSIQRRKQDKNFNETLFNIKTNSLLLFNSGNYGIQAAT